jgi:hypothetical protein
MRSRLLILGLIFAAFFTASLSYAQVPQRINYQGKLTTPEGALIDDTLSIVFTIYDAATNGGVLWTETQSSVIVENGVFSVLLGSVNTIPDSVFDGSVRYLGVKVEADPEMSPRKAIASVGYAFKSEHTDTAEYAHVTQGYFEDGIRTGDAASGDGTRFGKKYSSGADIDPIVSCYSGYVWWDYSEKALKVTETNAYNNHCHAAGYRDQGTVKDFYDTWISSGNTVTLATFTENGNWATFEITSEGPNAGFIHIHCLYSNNRLVAHYWYRYQ